MTFEVDVTYEESPCGENPAAKFNGFWAKIISSSDEMMLHCQRLSRIIEDEQEKQHIRNYTHIY